jgi:hypothetical protein
MCLLERFGKDEKKKNKESNQRKTGFAARGEKRTSGSAHNVRTV